jgi:hypothetical protein
MFRQYGERNVNTESPAMLNITVEYVEKLAVTGVEIATQNNSRLLRFRRNNVDNLEKTLVPYLLGFTSEKSEIDFVMNVADMICVGLFFRYDAHFLRFQLVRRILLNDSQKLRVFSCSGWTVKYHVAQVA